MKTKIGKYGVFAALTAVLLVTAALITSCGNATAGTEEYQPGPGKGYVKVSVPNTIERSVTTTLTFSKYDLTFKGYNAAGTTPTGTNVPFTGVLSLTNPFELNPGYYKLEVLAYEDEPGGTPGTDYIAQAEGTSAVFQITVNVGTSVTVPVGPMVSSGTGTGDFEYEIDLNGATATAATLTITEIFTSVPYASSGTSVNILASVLAGTSAQITGLPTGYYYVDITVTASSGTAKVRQVLHIYEGLLSSYVYTFQDNQLIITTGSASVIPAPYLVPTLTSSVPAAAVIETTTLVVDMGSGTPAATVITVTNAGVFDTIEWIVNGETLTSTEGVGGTKDSVLTVTAGNAPFDSENLFHVTVIGTTAENAVYSTSFRVSVLDS